MFGQGMFDEPDWGVADESTYDDEPMVVDEFSAPQQQAAPPPTPQPAPQRPRPVPQAQVAVPMPVMPAFATPVKSVGEVTADTQKGAGVGLLLIALGGGAGAFAGGLYGAAAGVLGMGALRNALRAKKLWSSTAPEDQAEAGMSATTAGFGLLAAGFLIYQSYQKRK